MTAREVRFVGGPWDGQARVVNSDRRRLDIDVMLKAQPWGAVDIETTTYEMVHLGGWFGITPDYEVRRAVKMFLIERTDPPRYVHDLAARQAADLVRHVTTDGGLVNTIALTIARAYAADRDGHTGYRAEAAYIAPRTTTPTRDHEREESR